MTHRMITHVEHCMGTVFSFRVDTTDLAEDALPQVVRRLHTIDAMFSTYRPDSEISRINAGELDVTRASPDVRTVLAACERFESLTEGWFSARPDGSTLDPSGYVKGWAVQEAADTLWAAGSRHHCVNGGGDVVCAGTPGPGRSWRIGIADPHDRNHLLEIVEGAGPLAVATSGSAERGAHILDPRTHHPAEGLASVTIVATDLITADVYATAAFAMGAERAQTWLDRSPDLWAILVEAERRRVDVNNPRKPLTGLRGDGERGDRLTTDARPACAPASQARG